MKKILVIVLSSILLTGIFSSAKFALFPVLNRDAESGPERVLNDDSVRNLFIGSSMFRQGINTADLFDNSSFLLAYNGNQPWMEKILLEYLFENGKKIDTVFVDMYAYSISEPKAGISDDRLLMHLPFSSICSTFSVLRKNGNAGLKELYEMFVSSNNELFITWPVTFPLINSRSKNGSNLGVTSGKTAKALETEKMPEISSENIDGFQSSCMTELIELCHAGNTNVVFVETPKYERLYETDTYAVLMSQYLELLKDKDCGIIMSERTASAVGAEEDPGIIRYAFDNKNADYFKDLIHLSSNGRDEMTKILKDCYEKGFFEKQNVSMDQSSNCRTDEAT